MSLKRKKSEDYQGWLYYLGRIILSLITGLFLLFIIIPLVALFFRAAPAGVWAALQQPDVIQALQISLFTTTCSALLIIITGLPVAYLLARKHFPGKAIIETLVSLPTVLPPVVAGLALLLAFGRMGLLGSYLYLVGISIPFTTAAVVLAQIFVAAPFFINSAKAGFMQLDPRYEQAAYTLRASPWYTFWHITIPLMRPALLAGLGQAWARALGEFGATITFAGSFPGTTQTLPIAVYLASETDIEKAIAIAVVLLITSFTLLLMLKTTT